MFHLRQNYTQTWCHFVTYGIANKYIVGNTILVLSWYCRYIVLMSDDYFKSGNGNVILAILRKDLCLVATRFIS